MALWTIIAFSNAFPVIIWLALIPSPTSFMISRPARRAHESIFRMVAGIRAEPGSASPRASAMHCMVLAVPRKVQAPTEGHPVSL